MRDEPVAPLVRQRVDVEDLDFALVMDRSRAWPSPSRKARVVTLSAGAATNVWAQ